MGLLSLFVLSALDRRFGWSHVPAILAGLGDALLVGSFLIFYFVFRVNSFGASNIRVEEHQTLVSSGPYAMVRHPMYVGALVMSGSIPLALGSWWGFAPIAVLLPVLIVRILDEEKVLEQELAGYREYEQKVRFRLLPYLW